MNTGRTVFAQLMNFLPAHHFHRCVQRYQGSYKVQRFSCSEAFYGTSDNAVKTQIWIAISVYVLVAIVKKVLRLELSLYTILQIVSVTVFEKVDILEVLTEFDYRKLEGPSHKQPTLFEL